mmetsp:Transcript_39001/g.70247  ORF Transcript_39001/g.70247 Transcript_39001/m.70247 type:complete len:205 (+) Transcript_39001:606-1220(+)
MKRRASDPMIPVSGPGSENSIMASLDSIVGLESFLRTRWISQSAISFSGTFRMPKDMVAALIVLSSSESSLRASPNFRLTILDRSACSTFVIPTFNMFCDGSNPNTADDEDVDLYRAAAFPSNIATSAVPVAKSRILTVSPLFSLFVNISPSAPTTSFTNRCLHDMSKFNAKARFMKSYRVAIKSNMEPVPWSDAGDDTVALRN